MLTFLRNLRRSFIDTSSFHKYLLYAFGEIALVVIGILIALAADSALDQIKENKHAVEVLQSIRNDIVDDLSALENYWDPQNEGIIASRKRLKEFLNSKTPIVDSANFVFDVIWVSMYATFDPHTTTIEELKSSNGIRLLKNQNMKAAILDYYNSLENILEFDVIHRAHFLDQFGNLTTKIVGGFGLSEGFAAIQADQLNPDLPATKVILDADQIRSTDYLRELIESTSIPFSIKELRYRMLGKEARKLIDLIDNELE